MGKTWRDKAKALERARRRALEVPPEPKPRKPNTIQAAHDTVFAICELLEAILLDVDMRTLLVSVQRVCKRWNAVIASSPPLQRRLFFLPSFPRSSCEASSTAYASVQDCFEQNPLLQWAFPCFFVQDFDKGPCPDHVQRGHLPKGFVLAGTRGNVWRTELLPMLDTRFRERRHRACARRCASWRRMLVSQPPPVTVARVGTMDESPEPPRRMAAIPGGLRMGALYDEVFAVNWEGRARSEMGRLRWAWIVWRAPEGTRPPRARGCWHRPEMHSARWYDSADLVIGETSRGSRDQERGCETHLELRKDKGGKCFLKHQSFAWTVGHKGTKWLYRCEDYEAGETPLTL